MSDTEPKNRGGRPATGVTTKRQVRIGEEWDRAESMAAQLGMPTARYVEQALKRENDRVERQLKRDPS